MSFELNAWPDILPPSQTLPHSWDDVVGKGEESLFSWENPVWKPSAFDVAAQAPMLAGRNLCLDFDGIFDDINMSSPPATNETNSLTMSLVTEAAAAPSPPPAGQQQSPPPLCQLQRRSKRKALQALHETMAQDDYSDTASESSAASVKDEVDSVQQEEYVEPPRRKPRNNRQPTRAKRVRVSRRSKSSMTKSEHEERLQQQRRSRARVATEFARLYQVCNPGRPPLEQRSGVRGKGNSSSQEAIIKTAKKHIARLRSQYQELVQQAKGLHLRLDDACFVKDATVSSHLGHTSSRRRSKRLAAAGHAVLTAPDPEQQSCSSASGDDTDTDLAATRSTMKATSSSLHQHVDDQDTKIPEQSALDLHSVFAQWSTPSCVTTVSGRVVEFNPMFARLFGLPPMATTPGNDPAVPLLNLFDLLPALKGHTQAFASCANRKDLKQKCVTSMVNHPYRELFMQVTSWGVPCGKSKAKLAQEDALVETLFVVQ